MRRFQSRPGHAGMGIVVHPQFGPRFGIIDVHVAELENLVNDFGLDRIIVASWGDYGKGKSLYNSKDYAKIKDILAGETQ